MIRLLAAWSIDTCTVPDNGEPIAEAMSSSSCLTYDAAAAPLAGADVLMIVVGAVVLVAAALAVFSRRIVHAALALIAALGIQAVMYFLLGASTVGITQVLVYVGAVVVLMVFALMVTRSPIHANPELDASLPRRLVAGVAGIAMTALIAGIGVPLVSGVEVSDVAGGDPQTLASALFTQYALPFEVLSFVLLAALVAALVVADKDAPIIYDGAAQEAQESVAEEAQDD